MDNEFILDFDQFIRSVEISKTDFFTVLLGAGASINSGIKSANECIWEWKKYIYTTKTTSQSTGKLDIKSEQVRQLIQKWLDNEGIYPAAGSPEEYSFYIEKCYPIEDDRRKYFQRLCAKKEPSVGYKLLCLLSELGTIKSVWTTNFDDLCRDAAIKTNNTVIDITLDSVDRIIRPINNAEMLLIKLHGDYKYGPLKNTDYELKTQDETFRTHLIDYLKDKHLIISGYSGRDQSIMSALKESYSQRGSGRLYWCGYGQFPSNEVSELLALARSNGRSAFYIRTDGFDKLMISLAKECCNDNSLLSDKFQEYLKAEKQEITRTPFSIDSGKINNIIKGNLFPIKLPKEAFQFESDLATGEQPWRTIKNLIKSFSIVAVPHKGYIWAFGTLSDINTCFEGHIKSTITRVAIDSLDLWKDTAIYNLLISSLTKTLSGRKGLHSNGKNLIWKTQHTSHRIFQNTMYSTHEAVRLSFTTDGKRYFLSLLPDFRISTDDPNAKISKEVRQDVGRTYFDKLRNKAFDEYLLEWRKQLFKGSSDKLLIEYPYMSGTGFNFEIYRLPLFSKISNQTSKTEIQLSDKFPKALLHFNGIQYKEPELSFSPLHQNMNIKPKDFHPMRGLRDNAPSDSALTGPLFDNKINLGIICPKQDDEMFAKFLNKSNTLIHSENKNAEYLIDYPGFFNIYKVSLNVPLINSEDWLACPEPDVKKSIKETAYDLRDKIIYRIDQHIKNEKKKVIVIYIPDRWLSFTSFHEENEDFDLHDHIKGYCAEKGIATQFIQQDTINSTLQCQINWWLSLSYYVKSLRTPWVLDNLDKNTAFAGIGYSVSNKKSVKGNIVLGCSHIYNSDGQGLKYKLSKVQDQLYWDKQDSPHLSYNDAFRFGLSIKELFFNAMDELPKRVVVHKRNYFTKNEIDGLKDSLLNNGITDIDLVEINFADDIRFLATKISAGMPLADDYAVPRGTCIVFDEYSAFLWTHGIVPSVRNQSWRYYLGGKYIPGPLKITKHYGNSNIGTIANEILGLTKMNWNSFDLYSQLPVTLNSSNEIARIGRFLTKRDAITYDYRYFI
ncbi:MAG: SIR2 family protein [Sphingobacterium sp.]|jgi:hypothetical protein|nr:SIR2 family protein [Sphingobacterium sp.]